MSSCIHHNQAKLFCCISHNGLAHTRVVFPVSRNCIRSYHNTRTFRFQTLLDIQDKFANPPYALLYCETYTMYSDHGYDNNYCERKKMIHRYVRRHKSIDRNTQSWSSFAFCRIGHNAVFQSDPFWVFCVHFWHRSAQSCDDGEAMIVSVIILPGATSA